MTYLADTDWMINLLNDRAPFVSELGRLWPEGVALSILTIAELYEGVPGSRDPEATRKTVNGLHRSFPVLGLEEGPQPTGPSRAATPRRPTRGGPA